MAITLKKYIDEGEELTYSDVDNNWQVIENAINELPENLAVKPIPFGSFLWFKGNGNNNLTIVQAGDKRLILDADNNLLTETYTDGNWRTEGGQD
jgi:hypothetical protein